MNKELIFLNYIAFFVLFIIGLIFIFKDNTSLFGYILLFITNASFLVLISGEFLPRILVTIKYFIPLLTLFALIFTSILYFTCFVLILMMYYQLHVKFTLQNGLSINIPTLYKEELYNFNVLTTLTFFISTILLYIIYFKQDKLNVNFFQYLKYMSIYSTTRNYLSIICLIFSIILIIISSIQVNTANNLSKISGFVLNPSEIEKKI